MMDTSAYDLAHYPQLVVVDAARPAADAEADARPGSPAGSAGLDRLPDGGAHLLPAHGVRR